MLPFINLPVKIVGLFTSNTAASEVAAGVCLGMFMGFIPLNGPMAIALFICLLIFKINRLAAILVLPLFKLFYMLGVSSLTNSIGGILLIKFEFLAPLWSFITHFPVLALLDINNTLVAGGLALCAVLAFPVYMFSQKGIIFLRTKYFDKIKNSGLVKALLKLPLIEKAMAITDKIKGNT